jgi:hypothetical protein
MALKIIPVVKAMMNAMHETRLSGERGAPECQPLI